MPYFGRPTSDLDFWRYEGSRSPAALESCARPKITGLLITCYQVEMQHPFRGIAYLKRLHLFLHDQGKAEFHPDA